MHFFYSASWLTLIYVSCCHDVPDVFID
uniref:Uncharacterized protein n=1 Tax=Arundo donax TaxID=35708 RepID=A0A0A8ZAY9_ARUDO